MSTSTSPRNKTHPNTLAAFKARMESVVKHKKVLTPNETQCYATAGTNPMHTRLLQLAVPSPQRLEAIPSRMRTASPSPNRDQLRDRMGSIQFRPTVGEGGEIPFDADDSTEDNVRDDRLVRDLDDFLADDAEEARYSRKEKEARLFMSKSGGDTVILTNQPYLSAFTPSRYCRLSPSPNSFVNLGTAEKKERLRVVQPDARKYICTLRDRLSPEKVSAPLAYAVYGTAMKDNESWGEGGGPGGEASFRSGVTLTTEEQMKSILRNEKRKTATTITHEYYTILRNLFEEIDEDGSGYLELRELIQFRAQFPKRLPENVLHGLKLEQDGKVYLDDFLSTFYPCVSQSTLEQLMTAFEPKAKDLTSISAVALRELNAYYNHLRHSYWDFTLEDYAHMTGPFDAIVEHDRQLRACTRRRGKSVLAMEAYLGGGGTLGEGVGNTSFSSVSSRASAPQLNPLEYHLKVYRRRHRRGAHVPSCHYAGHPERIREQRSEQREMRDAARKERLLRATAMRRRTSHGVRPVGSTGRRSTAQFSVGTPSGEGGNGSSDTDTSGISTSSCSCDEEFADNPSAAEAMSQHRALNAYQWYLHEASVLSDTKGDASIGAFIAKLRMREVPLRPVIPGHVRHLLTGGGTRSSVIGGASPQAIKPIVGMMRPPSERLSVSPSSWEPRKSKASNPIVSLLCPDDLETSAAAGQGGGNESMMLGCKLRPGNGPRFSTASSNVLRFQMTPFLDGDQSKPNIPYLLACPIALKDFARVAMDYSVRKETNQPTYHYDADLAERIEGLRWHKLFPFTGDVRHFFKRFPNGSDDEISDDNEESKIPSYIRRGAGVGRKKEAICNSLSHLGIVHSPYKRTMAAKK